METPVADAIFEPVSSCTQDIYHALVTDVVCDSNNNDFEHACRYFHLGPTTSTADCFPSSWSPYSGAYISTGVCPRGYETVCASIQGLEKTATCCPSGYTCRDGSANGPPWYTTDLCKIAMPSTIVYIYTTRTPGKDFETSTTTGGGELNAFGMEVRWPLSDLVASTTTTTQNPSTSAPPSPSTSATNPGRTTATSQPLPAGTSPTSQEISAGAKAGIGIGAVAIFFLVLLMALLLWRWRKHDRGKTATASSGDNFQPPRTSGPGHYDEYSGYGPPASWYGHTGPSELSGEREIAEL